MAVFLTGDTHRDVDWEKLDPEWNPRAAFMGAGDHLIILGDFGAVWDGGKNDDYYLDWYQSRKYTTLFVPGNHENYEALRRYPKEEYCGGAVRRIRPNVMMLERGEVFTIDGCKFFCMGGAQSHDMWCRVPGRSWWEDEMPSDEEYRQAELNLSAHNWQVDYILTHCAPDSIQNKLDPYGGYEHDRLTNFLESVVKEKVTYWAWFFGHYHVDRIVQPGHIALYDSITQVI